jgi:hypothetical protein
MRRAASASASVPLLLARGLTLSSSDAASGKRFKLSDSETESPYSLGARPAILHYNSVCEVGLSEVRTEWRLSSSERLLPVDDFGFVSWAVALFPPGGFVLALIRLKVGFDQARFGFVFWLSRDTDADSKALIGFFSTQID